MKNLRTFLFGLPSNPPRWVDRAPLWLSIPAATLLALLCLAVLVGIGVGIMLLE